jgi:hypothetical protein
MRFMGNVLALLQSEEARVPILANYEDEDPSGTSQMRNPGMDEFDQCHYLLDKQAELRKFAKDKAQRLINRRAEP